MWKEIFQNEVDWLFKPALYNLHIIFKALIMYLICNEFITPELMCRSLFIQVLNASNKTSTVDIWESMFYLLLKSRLLIVSGSFQTHASKFQMASWISLEIIKQVRDAT